MSYMRDSHWRDSSRTSYSTNQAYPASPGPTPKSNGLLDDVPDYGSAFVCGKSRFESEKFHVKNDPILQVSCGDEHTGVITQTGRIFMFGSNNWGQLGLGHENNIDKPSCVKSLKHEKSKLIACGRNHTIIATQQGNLYSFGCNSESQLGLGESFSASFYSSPQQLESVKPQEWAMLSAGAGQSCALSENGDLYVWGINDNGELGIGKIIEQFTPKRVDLPFFVSAVACGYYHTAILSKKGKLYTTGSNEYYQLGHSRTDKKFNEVDKIEEPIKFVSCGAGHTVFATDDGYVYSMGDGAKGQLGLGKEILGTKSPRLIKALEQHIITKISSGECHTAFLSNKGQLLTCGDGRYGKLGLTQKESASILYSPLLVDKYKDIDVKNIACGGCHMILIGTVPYKKPSSQKRDPYDELDNDSYYKNRKLGQYSSRQDPDYSLGKKNDMPDQHSRSNKNDYYSEKNKSYKKMSDSDEMSNEEAEFTFNRTHTLTRDNKFVPLSETNLKKAAEESSSNRFNSNKYKSYSKTYNNENDTRKNEPKKPSNLRMLSDGSGSEADDYLFNRKKFYNTKEDVPRNKGRLSPLDNNRESFNKNTGSSSHRGLAPIKPYNSRHYATSNKASLFEDSDEDKPPKGFMSERNHTSKTDFTNYRNSNSNVRRKEDMFQAPNASRHNLRDIVEDYDGKQTDQVDTKCFRNRQTSPDKSSKPKICSIL